MSLTKSYIDSDDGTTDAQITPRAAQEKPAGQRLQAVLDDPSFCRLLRDGHHADATAYLLTQLEDGE